ncbi:hypothetical protein [Taklimakanibacter lacteus]|uniref:hypothetical protein n=1 Tax=Taklimakanibacter lacteus TaxID=2268456 RepID=UPI000E66E4B9
MLASCPVGDLIALIAWLFFVVKAWRGWTHDTSADSLDERNLGATVILGQLNSVITGSSIIIAGIAAFVAIEEQEIGKPESYHLVYATAWAVSALAVALYTNGILPSYTPKRNFVQVKGIAVLCSVALFLSLAAGVRFLFAVWSILF